MNNKAKWEQLHENSRFRPKYPEGSVVRYVFRNFNRDGKTKILDLGCGAGRHVFFLGRENVIPFGLDMSAPGIEYTKRLMEKNGMKAYAENLKCCDLQKIPFDDCFFDGIIAYGVLYYCTIAEIKNAVREMWRVLKPGGKSYVVVRGLEDQRYGRGEMIEKNTFLLGCENGLDMAQAESSMIMHFFDRAEIEDLFCNFSSVNIDECYETFGGGTWKEFNYSIELIK